MTDVVVVETRTDDADAVKLLNDYFEFRIAGFAVPGGYVVNLPDPARFVSPDGVFLVARVGADAVGCGGIRRIDALDGLTTFEVKHVWVAPAARGLGISRGLMDELERRAIGFGAQQLVLDTNTSLTAAQQLYRSSGYVEIEPYNDNPNATTWFAKRL